MAPEISLENQRPAKYVFDGQVQLTLSEIRANEAREKAAKAGANIGERGVTAHPGARRAIPVRIPHEDSRAWRSSTGPFDLDAVPARRAAPE